jgi:hypothetical protein
MKSKKGVSRGDAEFAEKKTKNRIKNHILTAAGDFAKDNETGEMIEAKSLNTDECRSLYKNMIEFSLEFASPNDIARELAAHEVFIGKIGMTKQFDNFLEKLEG